MGPFGWKVVVCPMYASEEVVFMNKETALSAVLIGAGIVFFSLNKYFANKTGQFYDRLLCRRFSNLGYRMVFVIAGISFFLFGIFSMFGIIHFK